MSRPAGVVNRDRVASGVSTRPAEGPDLAALAAAYYATYVGTTHEMTLAEAQADIDAARTGEYGVWDEAASLLARIDGVVAGAILVVSEAPWEDVPSGAFVSDLFVVPGARRRGIARRLVTDALALIDGEVWLRVDETNRPARSLYEGLGFAPV